MNMKQGDRWKCDCCKREFVAEWDDEEALAETDRLFPKDDKSDLARVCTDCLLIMARAGAIPPEAAKQVLEEYGP